VSLPVTSPQERERLAGLLSADHLPLFDDRFIGSCVLFDEYVHRLAIRVVREIGVEAAAQMPGTPVEIAVRAGLDPVRGAVPVGWLLQTLAARGLATRDRDGRLHLPGPLPDLDPTEVSDEQARLDASALASYRIAAIAGTLYSPVLRGAVSGEETLFAPERSGAWFEYFSNENLIYAINNQLGAIAVERELPAQGGPLLELGGGLGSGAAAVLARLAAADRLAAARPYHFTEAAASFLRRGQRRLAGAFPEAALAYTRLDMNRPFAEAGIAAGTMRVVYGVNTLHVANDLAFTLAEIRRALTPGGTLVLSECVRPFAGTPIHSEFIFNLLESFRAPRLVDPWRPNGGFLTPEQWTAALETCGFTEVNLAPDIARMRQVIPALVVAAIVARRA
jgi:SAM-dependent methyltransferase